MPMPKSASGHHSTSGTSSTSAKQLPSATEVVDFVDRLILRQLPRMAHAIKLDRIGSRKAP